MTISSSPIAAGRWPRRASAGAFIVAGAAVLAGCSFDPLPAIDTSADAHGADAEPDAMPRRGELRVVVSDGGAPARAVPVLFHSADGTWVATRRTDELGQVTHEVAEGDIVTVLSGTPPTARAWSVYAVAPGDMLRFRLPRDPASEQPSARVDVTFSHPGGGCTMIGRYCRHEQALVDSPFSFDVYPSCVDDGTVRFLLRCNNFPDSPTAVGSVALSAGQQVHAVTIGTYSTTPSSTTIAFSDGGTGFLTNLTAGLELVAGGERLEQYPFVRPTGDTGVWRRDLPRATGIKHVERAFTWRPVGGQRMSQSGYVLTTTSPRDGVTEELARWLPLIRIDEVPDDAGPYRVAWQPLGPVPDTADGILVTDQGTYRWTLVLPPTATSVTRPTLPDEFAAFRAAFPAAPSVRLVDADDLSGYVDFRAGGNPIREMSDGAAPPVGARWSYALGF